MELILFGLLAVMLVFMFLNTRKRQRQMKADQEEKANKTVPGARVLMQGGIYGTVVSYDGVDLDLPARIEIAPGTVIEVHSQAILRVIDPTEPDEAGDLDEVDGIDPLGAAVDTPMTTRADEVRMDEMPDPDRVETPEETRARLERNNDN